MQSECIPLILSQFVQPPPAQLYSNLTITHQTLPLAQHRKSMNQTASGKYHIAHSCLSHLTQRCHALCQGAANPIGTTVVSTLNKC